MLCFSTFNSKNPKIKMIAVYTKILCITTVLRLIIRASWASNQHIRMISEG